MYIKNKKTSVVKPYTPKTGDLVIFHQRNDKLQLIEFERKGFTISTRNSSRILAKCDLETMKDLLMALFNIQLVDAPFVKRTGAALILRCIKADTPKTL